MSTHTHIGKICGVITALTVLLTLLFMNGEALGISPMADEEDSGWFTANDLDGDWDASGATRIVLSDEGSEVHGNGAYVYQGDVYIVYAGRYRISGTLSNGRILVQADGDDKIWLLLDGVSLHCEDDAALRVEQAGKVFLTLAEGTENAISSGEAYSEAAVAANVDGAVYSRDDLTINGAGSLSVTAAYRHGVVCNDDLVITGGTVTVSAVQDGLHAHDSVRIRDADITVSAGDDGITASNDEGTSLLYVASGTIRIPACYEGLEAVSVTIAGGDIHIVATDDGINANGSGSVLRITGGDITIINGGGRDADGLDSNGDIFISGGQLLISVPDDGSSSAIDFGSESGGVCRIDGGTVLACGSRAMAEAISSDSAQGFLMYSASAEAGTAVTLRDSAGNELLREEVPLGFSLVIASAPGLQVGDSCTIAVGDAEETVTIDNSSAASAFGGGQIPGGMSGWGGRGQRGDMESSLPPADGGFPGFQGGEDASPPTLPDSQRGGTESSLPPADDGFSGFQGGEDASPPTLPDGQTGEPFQRGDKFGSSDRPQGTIGADGGGRGGQRSEWGEALPSEASSPPTEGLTLLAVSAAVLVIGCAVAVCCKRRD